MNTLPLTHALAMQPMLAQINMIGIAMIAIAVGLIRGGIYALVRKEVRLTKTKNITGTTAKVIGIISLVLGIALGLVIALSLTMPLWA